MLTRVIYTAVLVLVAPFLLLSLYKKKPGKPAFGKRWKEHFGVTPKVSAHSPVWIHAVSVGEVIAAIPLIKELKAAHPEQDIVVSTTTSTGAEQVEKLGDLVEHRYMPIDFSFAVRGFLKAVKPQKLLIIETELWPNTLQTVAKADIPITIINARLSEKSRQSYQRIQPIFNLVRPTLSQVLCQTEADAERFAALGIDSSKLAVTGSIKFDIQVPKQIREQSSALRHQLGKNRPVWIAASTHKGEDEQVLSAHRAVLAKQPSALLILVPRHPERFDAMFELCQQQGFETQRRTALTSDNGLDSDCQVYLADTMGEMLLLLGASDVCFMGGSLVGDKVGGHNLLEPTAVNIPSLTGPSYYNFKEITQALLELGIVTVVEDSQQLAEQVNRLLAEPQSDLVDKTSQFMHANSGALQRTLNLL
ncbi:3-deoxy-D-manno-octulosonic-acid transferase [Vibrio xiamenensis]|uniref:3-deoxy-D-manno-octulosonic acid transferase n=1 Tax=Vibrio xiamenensis TaxID=861298 RepID=A0A1G8EYV7_9VIBR|nr:lipid IV(A) 3-deoxy-D-manno-octulosonic acid transferase [Vibrio xiamenensis]SDH75032.1 3-deoxy-D-manno-octulosonic-acid transferase [Vibrio xiamenensis]